MDKITCERIGEIDITDNPTPRHWHEKEQAREAYAVVFAHDAGRMLRPMRVVWYMGRSRNALTVYCAVSISTANTHTHGHGSAGGGGYDKYSASLGEALRNAKVELSEPIDGTGRSRDAIEAIVECLYPGTNYSIEIVGRI